MKNILKSILMLLIAVNLSNAQLKVTKKQKILFILTSHNQLGNTGKKTGFWIEEFATPYYYFIDRGIEVVVATPRGGQAPIDPKSNEPSFQTESTKRFYSDAAAKNVLSVTKKLATIDQKDFDAIFYPGGHGPMWDLANDKNSIALISAFYNESKPVAFVCHGSAALINVKLPNGDYLLRDKKVTGFCNTEEEAVQLTQVVPFSLEDKLKERGGVYQKAKDWNSFAVIDGLLLTGQNPQSSKEVAEKLFELISK